MTTDEKIDQKIDAKIDERLMTYMRLAGHFFREVFGQAPELTFEYLPRGDHAIVIEGWLWLFWAGIDRRWTVRVVVPPDDPFYERFGCLRRQDGLEIEKPCLEDALLFALEKETHRRFHLTQDEIRRRVAG